MDAHLASHPSGAVLQAFALGQLGGAEAVSVEMHLRSCPDCRRRASALSQTTASFDDLSMLGSATGGAMPPTPGDLPPGLADHPDYRILRELGQGGMGVVYLARNTLMGRLEVLKVVGSHLLKKKSVFERFLGEIRNAARLQHPNIVAAYSAFRMGESLVLTMEYVDGFDLSRVVKAKGPLPVSSACKYIHQAALGLQHAHEHGMVHRDIKPANLMLSRASGRSVVKVLDFGLAKVQSERTVEGELTHEGQMLGTPDYIAPEQIRDARQADIRADIYSLGCTFYYLLTGRPPFQGTSLYDILQAHDSMEATPLNRVRPEVPAQVAAIVAKMMAKEPGQRFQQPQEVAQALRPFFMSGDAAAPAPSIETIRRAEPPPMPDARRPESAELPLVTPTLIESHGGNGQGFHLMRSPAMAIGVLVSALLASLSVAVWVGRGWNGDRVVDRPAVTPKPGPIAGPSTPAPPNEAGLAPRPPAPDAEALFRDAVAAIRGRNLNQARMLLSQYLARPQGGKKADEALALHRDIDLATSSMEAEALARRLSDQELNGYLDRGGQPLVDSSVTSTDLRRVYAETLLQAFRQEKQRRESASKEAMALVLGTGRENAPTPEAPPTPDAAEDRLPSQPIEPDDEPVPASAKTPRPVIATTIEAILDAAPSYRGRTINLDRAYRIGTLFTPVKGADGRVIGTSIPIATNDDRTLCRTDGQVVGRDAYLVLDGELAPVLLKALNDFRFQHAARPTHKSTLTVEVRRASGRDAGTPVLAVVGMEVLGDCNLLSVAERQFDKAFKVLRVTPREAVPVYGDGLAWVERLGGEEKFVKPLRKKVRDMQRRMITDRQGAIVGAMLQAELGRAVNMAVANQQQTARFAAAFFGR